MKDQQQGKEINQCSRASCTRHDFFLISSDASILTNFLWHCHRKFTGRDWGIWLISTLVDLRGCVFDGLNLSNVEFFGCRLDGVSFQRACLHGTRFIGCFSSSQSPPTDFTDRIWENTSATGCHLNYLSEQDVPGFHCWPTEIVEAAEKTLHHSNDVRNRVRLGTLGNPVVAPYLATLLALIRGMCACWC